MGKRGIFLLFLFMFAGSTLFADTFGVKKRMPRPNEYGNVIINNYSVKNHMPPVVFKHWLHRARYTCRLCHVDLGFAMTPGGTDIKEADIMNGLYCGACDNGKIACSREEKTILGKNVRNCNRCHSSGIKVRFKKDFYKETRGFPRSRFGNRVDWLKVEEKGEIKLTDYLEGVTIKRKALKIPKTEEIKGKVTGMPSIIFSHKKHAVWNGCELCHPEIFGVKKGGTRFSMQDIFDGKFCGACHGKVAFSNLDCQLCHSKEI